MTIPERKVVRIPVDNLTLAEAEATVEQVRQLPERTISGRLIPEMQHERGRTVIAQVRLVHPLAKLPSRKRDSDAGYDVHSVQRVIVPIGRICMVQTGIQLAVPVGWYYTIDGRSSMWSKGILAYRGIVDSGYIGECVVALQNTSGLDYQVEPGDRIAQIILHRAYEMDIMTVEEFTDGYNHRGTCGFGASGR